MKRQLTKGEERSSKYKSGKGLAYRKYKGLGRGFSLVLLLPALLAQGPEFDPQYSPKKEKENIKDSYNSIIKTQY